MLLFLLLLLGSSSAQKLQTVCSMEGRPILYVTKNQTGLHLFNESQKPNNSTTTPTDRRRHRLQAKANEFQIFTKDRYLQQQQSEGEEFAVRECICPTLSDRIEDYDDITSITTTTTTDNKYYCEANRNLCEIHYNGNHKCWNPTLGQFVGNLFPFVFFWFGILFLAFFWTQLGRSARMYIFRKIVPCWKERHQNELHRELEYLMIRRPENVMMLVRSYGRRIQQQRRHRNRRQQQQQSTTTTTTTTTTMIRDEDRDTTTAAASSSSSLSSFLRQAAAILTSRLPYYFEKTSFHPYIDKQLGIRDTLRTGMESLSSKEFEQVLHPIFEEDELTLILAGGALGFTAGYIQQLLSTGVLILPTLSAILVLSKKLLPVIIGIIGLQRLKIIKPQQLLSIITRGGRRRSSSQR